MPVPKKIQDKIARLNQVAKNYRIENLIDATLKQPTMANGNFSIVEKPFIFPASFYIV